MIRLTERQLISMHSSLIAAIGGMDGVRGKAWLFVGFKPPVR